MNPPANTGDTRDMGLIPGSGRSPGEGNGNPFQYSCLENSMDRRAWQAIQSRGLQRVKYKRAFRERRRRCKEYTHICNKVNAE